MNAYELAKKMKEEKLKEKERVERLQAEKTKALQKEKNSLISSIEKTLSSFKEAGFEFTKEGCDEWGLRKDDYLILTCTVKFNCGYKEICNDDYFKYDGDSYYITLTNKRSNYSYGILDETQLNELVANIMKDYL